MTTSGPEAAEPILRLLAERIGLDPASVGENLIRAGVRNRMKQLGVESAADYQRILLGPTDEVQALIEEVVIPESWFFRDDRPFAAFREIARWGWVDRPSRSPLSVLCLPCAGGEEPYSVVMALLDLGLPRERFEVVAVDVSERSLLRAARGIYGVNSFRGVPNAVRDRYFDPAEVPGRFLLRPAVRAAVRFERGNILDEGLLAGRPGFDVVFCRNLLIYFDATARACAARTLDRLAAADGHLFLGHADRPDATLLARFEPHGDPGSFLYHRRSPDHLRTGTDSVLIPPFKRPPVPALGRGVASTQPALSPPAAALVPPIAPAAPRPTVPATRSSRSERAAGEPTETKELLVRAAVLADRGLYTEAAELIRRHLGRGLHDAPAHFLLGMVFQAAGDRPRAEAELLKAVYLDPEHDEALLALALLARRRGDVAAEALLRRRAERVRGRKGGG